MTQVSQVEASSNSAQRRQKKDAKRDEGERFTPLLTREAHTFSQMRTDRGAPRTFSALCFPGWKQS
jgi:hypothetical protein